MIGREREREKEEQGSDAKERLWRSGRLSTTKLPASTSGSTRPMHESISGRQQSSDVSTSPSATIAAEARRPRCRSA